MSETDASPDVRTAVPAVEELLVHEARLLDERRFDDWLDLLSPAVTYWIPCNDYDIDPLRHVSIAFDDRSRLEERIWRIQSGWAHAQDPPSRTRRIVSNIEVSVDGGQLISSANFIVAEVRRHRQRLFAGRYEHAFEQGPEGLVIARKKIELLTNDDPIDNLTFIL